MEILSHPLTLLLVGFLLTQLVTLGGLLARMYARLSTVKADTERIDKVVEEVRDDVVELKTSQATLTARLTAHMDSEEQRDARIVQAIEALRTQP